MKLKIMTFNVQHMRNYNHKDRDDIDFEFFGNYIRSKEPDIIGLNEVRSAGESVYYADQVNLVGDIAGMNKRFFAEAIKVGGNNPYGNGMFSKYNFEAKVIPIPDPEVREPEGMYFESRCVLKASFDFEGKKLTVLATHFGLNPSEAKNAVSAVCEIADSLDTPLILMGDFNLTPDSPLLESIRMRFFDTEKLIPGDNHYTYPSDAPNCKIDYIFTRGVDVIEADINRDVVSDHYSIWATIDLK